MLSTFRIGSILTNCFRGATGVGIALFLFVLVSNFIVSDSMAEMTFTNITKQAGIDNPAKGSCLAFVDYDGDGYVDVYVGNSGIFLDPLGKPNILYHNNGDGTFSDMAVEAGIAGSHQTQGVAFGDLDNDGDPDLYVVNDFAINALYLNRGDGSFEDVTDAAGVRGAIDVIGGEESPNGYGTALADGDNDGYLDIYVVNLGGANILYRNNGDGTFLDITAQADVGAGRGVQGAGTAAAFCDTDNDGMLDLYAANGYGLPSFSISIAKLVLMTQRIRHAYASTKMQKRLSLGTMTMMVTWICMLATSWT